VLQSKARPENPQRALPQLLPRGVFSPSTESVAHGQEDPSATDPIEFVYHPAISEVAFPAQPPGGEKMESYRIDRFGSVNGIVLRSSEDPRPGLKEVLIRVRASSLNYRDLMVWD
jgi:hypothetical protein